MPTSYHWSLNRYQEQIARLQDTGKYRQLPRPSQPNLDFSSNDYLGLSQHPEVIEAAIQSAKRDGVGATGSRLLSGNKSLFEAFEAQIARDKRTESALIFNSGFQANMSVLSSLLDAKILGAKPLVFFDKLNHASLYQAVFLSGAELIRYRHHDMKHLSDLLEKTDHTRQKFIVSETIFGMDGDILPLEHLLQLAKTHEAFLYLDEAHATGILGPRGYGLSTAFDLSQVPHLIMGTFSKAIGCSGAYIACTENLKQYLINSAPGFIYSTAPSPMIIAAAQKAWELVEKLGLQRKQLLESGAVLRQALTALGFHTGNTNSHIVPLILGSEEATLEARDILSQHGIQVSAIRPPTVPPGTARLRIALNSQHRAEDLQYLQGCLKTIKPF